MEWPASFREFLTKSVQISMSREPCSDITRGAVAIDKIVAKGMTPKKIHEVNMTSLCVWRFPYYGGQAIH